MADVTITFAGMCLLVPDSTMLHILMPHTGGSTHHPRLVVLDASGRPRKHNITGMHLELENATGSFNPAMPAGIFDFAGPPLGVRKVPRTNLDPVTPLPGVVRTRIRLGAGKEGGIRRPGGIWDFNPGGSPKTRRVPTAVDWVIPGLAIPHLKIIDRVSGTRFQAFPDRSGAINLLMVHVTPPELARIFRTSVPTPAACPPNKHRAAHFKHYADLLDPSTTLPEPAFDLPASTSAGICPIPLAARGRGGRLRAPAAAAAAGSELTCMVATAPPR